MPSAKTDPELLAIARISRILEGLPEPVVRRVVAWVADRFGGHREERCRAVPLAPRHERDAGREGE